MKGLTCSCDRGQAHYRDYGKMTYARSVLVIHNIAHQGRGPFAELSGLEVCFACSSDRLTADAAARPARCLYGTADRTCSG